MSKMAGLSAQIEQEHLDKQWLKELKFQNKKNNEYIVFLLYLLYENQKRYDNLLKYMEENNDKK